MRRAVAAWLPALVVVLAPTCPLHAWCRVNAPVYSDANPVRVVIHPDMHNYIRHPFVDPMTGQTVEMYPCTSSAQCGTDGLCASGYPEAPTSRCLGARWTRSELERAVLWVVGRINHETPADIPFVYVDLNDTHTCDIDEAMCGDSVTPWVNCFQFNTITIMPSECHDTDVVAASWNGSAWVPTADPTLRNKIVRMGWSGSPAGQAWEHTNGMDAANFPQQLLHELGHGLGLGHPNNEYPLYPTCVPVSTPPVTPLCPAGAQGTCPVMHGDGGQGLGLGQHFYGFDDIQGLVSLYGLDSSPETRSFEDCDLGASPSFYELPVNDLPLITDMAASPVPPLTSISFVAIGGRERSVSYMERFQIWEWSYATASATLSTTIATPSFRSTGPIGVSVSTTHRMLSTHPPRLTNDSRMWRRQIHTVRRPSGGGTDSVTTFNPSAGSAADTAIPGVSSAFHAATNSWLHLIRHRVDGEVLLVGVRPDTGATSVLPLGFRSFATPSIACSPNRCFIAFVEVPSPLAWGSTQTRLQWTEGTVAWPTGGNVSFTYTAGITTSWYNVVSDPVASVVQKPGGGWYYYVSTSWPQISGGAWGTRVLTYRRTEGVTGTNALVQMTPLLPHSPGIAEQPTVGGTGVCAELFTSRSP